MYLQESLTKEKEKCAIIKGNMFLYVCIISCFYVGYHNLTFVHINIYPTLTNGYPCLPVPNQATHNIKICSMQ